MKILRVIAALLVLSGPAASAAWTVETRLDAMTDEEKRSAIVTNDEGHSFSVYRIEPGGAAWANFALSDQVLDQLDSQKAIMYRVDKNDAVNLEEARGLGSLGIRAYEWEPKWINFRIWHGKIDEGLSNSLAEMLTGERLVVRYFLATGGFKDTEFSLVGSSRAIAEALGIPASFDREDQARQRELRERLAEEATRCRQSNDLRACIERVSACKEEADGDVDRLTACLR